MTQPANRAPAGQTSEPKNEWTARKLEFHRTYRQTQVAGIE